MLIIGHTTLSFIFDSVGEHEVQLRIWITETQTSHLLGIEVCRQNVSNLQVELLAIEIKELKDTANAFCSGNLSATKPYLFVSNLQPPPDP